MRGISQKRDGVGCQPADYFSDHEGGVQGDADGELPATAAFGVVMGVIMNMIVRHGQRP